MLFRIRNSVVIAFVDKFFDKFVRDFLPAFGVFFQQKKRSENSNSGQSTTKFCSPTTKLWFTNACDLVWVCVFVFYGALFLLILMFLEIFADLFKFTNLVYVESIDCAEGIDIMLI